MAFQVIDNRRASAENFAAMQRSISEGLSKVLDSIAAAKEIRGRREMNQNIMRALQTPDLEKTANTWLEPGPGGPTAPVSFAPGTGSSVDQSSVMRPFEGTQEAKMARVMDAIARTQAGGATPRVTGFGPIDSLLGGLNPNVPTFNDTSIEDMIAGLAVKDMFRDPMEDEYRRAQIDSAKALAQSRSRLANKPAPSMTPEEQEVIDLMAKLEKTDDPSAISIIEKALSRNPVYQRRHAEEGLSALPSLFPGLVEGKPRIKRVFGDKVYGDEAYASGLEASIEKGKEYGLDASIVQSMFDAWWDEKYQAEQGQRFQKYGPRPTGQSLPTSPPIQEAGAPAALPPGTGIGKANIRSMPTAPRPEFAEIWPELTDEEKRTVQLLLDRGKTPEELVAHFRKKAG